MLIATVLNGDVGPEEFWRVFESSTDALAGVRVHDPFCGGGTTLVEAARLGGLVSGSDVDPLATEISSLSLARTAADAIESGANALISYLESALAGLWPTTPEAQPLHYFYLSLVTCPECGVEDYLHRNLVIARWLGHPGAVRRAVEVVAFCPACLALKELASSDRSFMCCGQEWPLDHGNFRGQRYHCTNCEMKSLHSELRTGAAPRRLIAIEVTNEGAYRTIRAPREGDFAQVAGEDQWLEQNAAQLDIPSGEFVQPREDQRPVSLGLPRYRDCFTSRQLATFGLAFRWLDRADMDPETRRALRLAVSSALSSNNRLCGYATDYGRLSPIFSIRGYAFPALQVELNPLHRTGGRGTLRSVMRGMLRASRAPATRYVWDPEESRARPVTIDQGWISDSTIKCAGAANPDAYPPSGVDAIMFDPPYFDYIAYQELSEFYRAWLGTRPLADTPLHPQGHDPERSFAVSLGECLRQMSSARRSSLPISFTYHSAHRRAWQALGRALDLAELCITALWPIRNDAHMGLHTSAGNCEWDVVVVCRPGAECTTLESGRTIDDWLRAVTPLTVSDADRRNFGHAIEMALTRSGSIQSVRGLP